MTVFYKATRLDGRDSHTGRIDYAAAVGGPPLTPDLPDSDAFPGPGWLHLATVPTECVGMQWPCRLFAVAPVGVVRRDEAHPHKVGCRSVRVLREAPAAEVFGPQGEAVVALIDRAGRLTGGEVRRLAAAWAAAGAAAWAAAGAAAGAAARDAARAAAGAAAGAAAWDAARAVIVADLAGQHGLTQEHVDTLLAPWRAVIGDPLEDVKCAGEQS